MNDDNNKNKTESKSSFGLSRLRNGITNEVSELSSDAAARSTDGSFLDRNKPFTYEQENYDRTEAPRDDMRRYWRQFETTPIIRKPITSFATRVTEPGYYIEAEELSEEEVKRLGEWLDSCAIIEGQPGKDFRELANKSVVQREVRGTALIEKAPHKKDNDKIAGLKLINPETVEAVTIPDQSILMPPEGIKDMEDRMPTEIHDYGEIPQAESGGYAAWLQDILETDQVYFQSNFSDTDGDQKIGFRRDEIIPLRRDADVGEIFGTSRIESVSNRVRGIKDKLDDNDQAIASKAYPLLVFMFGDPETEGGVWDSDDINDFMQAHEMENFEPGMKQGVRGDVSIEQVSGEVANIAEYLQFDIQWIMSSMPMPLFLLGSFNTASVGQVAGIAQQQDVLRQIEDARRELEEEFTPVIREVAQQQGIAEDVANRINIRFGEPGQPDPEVARSQQVIRYVSDSGSGGQTQRPGQVNGQGTIPPVGQGQGQGMQPANQPQSGSPKQGQGQGQGQEKRPDGVIGKGETPQTVSNPAPDQNIAGVDDDGNPFSDMVTGDEDVEDASRYTDVWNARTTASLEQYNDTPLANTIHDHFITLRDKTLDTVEQKYSQTPKYAASEFEHIANTKLNRTIREYQIKQESQKSIEQDIQDLNTKYDELFNTSISSTDARFYAQNIRNAVRDASEEMLRKSRKLVRDAVITGADWNTVRSRIEEKYNDANLKQRASIIAQMETTNATETLKLKQFKQSENVKGVEIVNPNSSKPITKSLNGTRILFKNGTLEEQLDNHVPSDTKLKGFDPLPQTPPYHFNDSTSLQPITRKEQ